MNAGISRPSIANERPEMSIPDSAVASVKRPALVTVILVLIVLNGISSILSGIVAVTAVKPAVGTIVIAIVSIVIGLIYFAVAKGLWTGQNIARLIVAIVSVLQILFGIWAIFKETGGARSSAITTGVISVIILVVLYSPKANAFFAPRSN